MPRVRRWAFWREPEGRRCRCVNLAAGECGVKDQVSRTQPNFDEGPTTAEAGGGPVGLSPS